MYFPGFATKNLQYFYELVKPCIFTGLNFFWGVSYLFKNIYKEISRNIMPRKYHPKWKMGNLPRSLLSGRGKQVLTVDKLVPSLLSEEAEISVHPVSALKSVETWSFRSCHFGAKVVGTGQSQAGLPEPSRTMKSQLGLPSPEGTGNWRIPDSAPHTADGTVKRNGQKLGFGGWATWWHHSLSQGCPAPMAMIVETEWSGKLMFRW